MSRFITLYKTSVIASTLSRNSRKWISFCWYWKCNNTLPAVSLVRSSTADIQHVSHLLIWNQIMAAMLVCLV